MADWRRPAVIRGAVCLCVLAGSVLAGGGTALAQDVAPSGGGAAAGGTSGTGTSGTGAANAGTSGTGTTNTGSITAFPGSTGPILAAPSVLQQTGFAPSGPDVRLGNLGARVTSLLPGSNLQTGPTRAWSFTPSLSGSEEYITGGQGGANGRSNQFITTIQPGIAATADTVRLNGQFFYNPQVSLYSRSGSQDQVAQNVNTRLLATLVEQTVYLDLRGSGSQQTIAAGQSPYGATTQANSNLSQSYSFSAAPYAIHRFGDWGTGEIGGSIGRTLQSAVKGLSLPTTPTLASAFASAGNQNVTSTGGHLAFVTGEAFAHYNGAAEAQATSFSGSGVLQGAYRRSVTLDNGYALTRTITALATIGWEDIHYSGTAPVTIDDAIWSFGARLTPNPDSSITLRYGHQDGVTSVYLNGAYQVTARTRLFASYSEGLTTTGEQIQNALATSDLDALGNPVDHTTGAPIVAVGNFFGLNSNLSRTTLATVTIAWAFERDSLSASANSQTQTQVSASSQTGLANGTSRGVYGTLSWGHALWENLRSTTYLEYGTSSSSGAMSGNTRLVTVSTGLSYLLRPTLTGNLQYIFSQTSGQNTQLTGSGNGSGAQSVILVNLSKTF